MGIVSFILGILSLMGTCLALIPLLNLFNCIMLPLALFGAIFGLVDVLHKRDREQSNALGIAGLVMNLLALAVGGTRFVISLLTTWGIV